MGNKVTKRKKSSDGNRKKFKKNSSQEEEEDDRNVKIAEATAAAIAANGSPPAQSNTPVTKDTMNEWPEYQRRNVRPLSMERRCLMLFPTSGHMGFDIIQMSDELPPIETIREMIAYETRLRLSEPIQELMELYHSDESALT